MIIPASQACAPSPLPAAHAHPQSHQLQQEVSALESSLVATIHETERQQRAAVQAERLAALEHTRTEEEARVGGIGCEIPRDDGVYIVDGHRRSKDLVKERNDAQARHGMQNASEMGPRMEGPLEMTPQRDSTGAAPLATGNSPATAAGDLEKRLAREMGKAVWQLKTSDVYRTVGKLPRRFEEPGVWRYATKKTHPLYTTTSSQYGQYCPTVHDMPTTFHGQSARFSEHLNQAGPYRNFSLNTK
ncbi:hypothetical protein HK104_000757 [Borealophlyctis nickersoniae]|nr:hypothetical protein HK104_000757 [Borealophlyctis nickersoniae]